MGRRPRYDAPGTWHHVTNRALGRRAFFDGDQDRRYFLSLVARAVRAGLIEVHAYVLMTTHFHMLIRSLRGKLSLAMRDIEWAYVVYFNNTRTQRRDGPLVRGRFFSKPVRDDHYRGRVVRYIDWNPTREKMCRTCADYRFGSAWSYARPKGPPWLERSWVEGWVLAVSRKADYSASLYAQVFSEPTEADLWLIDARLRSSRGDEDDLAELLTADHPGIRAWLRRQAQRADGFPHGLPVVDPDTVDRVVQEARREPWTIHPRRRGRCGWTVAHIALLRELVKLTGGQIAGRLRTSRTRVHAALEVHRQMMATDAPYGERLATLAQRVLRGSGSRDISTG